MSCDSSMFSGESVLPQWSKLRLKAVEVRRDASPRSLRDQFAAA